MWRVKLILSSCLGLVLAAPAVAKCPMQIYRIEGSVELPPGVDGSSVRIYAFLEGSNETSDLPPEPGQHEYTTVSPDGFFVLRSWLHTDSTAEEGRISRGRDRCNRKAAYVDVIVLGDKIRTQRARARFSWPASSPAPPTAVVPPILLKGLPNPATCG